MKIATALHSTEKYACAVVQTTVSKHWRTTHRSKGKTQV